MGVYAVCSAHPEAIAAAAHEAKHNESVLHVESSSSQVNQFGGYRRQNPEQFAHFVSTVACDFGLAHGRILLGGDYLGLFPWRHGRWHLSRWTKLGLWFARVCSLVIRRSTSMPARRVLTTPKVDWTI
jgi:tagatose-1,6-bisphosphate aldolase non-catalytic subunit AgaZ/GatZ